MVRRLGLELEGALFPILVGEAPARSIENWVYVSDELERILNKDAYLELISMDFHANDADVHFWRIFEPIVDEDHLRTWHIRRVLQRLQLEAATVGDLVRCYEWWCGCPDHTHPMPALEPLGRLFLEVLDPYDEENRLNHPLPTRFVDEAARLAKECERSLDKA